ncbi:hypothetical protein ABZY06_21525 [Streptomyces sp. NPDC006540]|jgi:hypothetical protein|uniref:hypothetical protein n=1 Tax=Streptomyces sp. NPDC006540 TaxID=3155353 RepID=UPI0033B59E34
MSSEVLVGLVGAGAALTGALIGAGGAVLAARHTALGSRYQADRQAAAQHEQWLRQSRLSAVVAVIQTVRTMRDAMTDVVAKINRGESVDIDAEWHIRISPMFGEVSRCIDELNLQVSEPLRYAALGVTDQLQASAAIFRTAHLAPVDWASEIHLINEAARGLMEQAHALFALEEHSDRL